MTNEEKALEIAADRLVENGALNFYCDDNRFQAALEMAQWKDEQFEKLLHELMICAQQGYTQCASDELTISEMKKILKGINYDNRR